MFRRDPIPTWSFVVVVVRKGSEFLLVHERKHGQRWYFPAGRVELGETFEDAAHRETREEAGIEIELDGILRIEHTPRVESSRLRIFYAAHPKDDAPPKSEADDESLEARWFTLEEIRGLPLRGMEVAHIIRSVVEGVLDVVPLTLIQREP